MVVKSVALSALVVAIVLAVAWPGGSARGQAEPPLQAKVGSFTKREGIGDQQVTGVGFRPKALILFGTTQESEGFAGGHQMSLGFSDGVNYGAIGGWSWNHRVGSDADCAQVDESGNPAALLYVETIGNIAASATVSSFDSDGFTLSWDVDEGGDEWLVHYLAIGGDELTNARVGMLDADNDETSEVSYQGLGFQPDVVLFLGVRYRTIYPHPNFPLNLSLGFATDGNHQGTVAVASENCGRNPTDTWRYQRTSKCIAFLSPVSGEVESEAEFVSMDTDGFTLDWTDAASEDRSFYYMALKGGSYYVGSETQRTGTPGTKATTGVGFEPLGLFLASFNRAPSSANESDNRLSIGATSGQGGQAAVWVGDTDDVRDDTHTDNATYTTKALALCDSDSPTSYDAAADLSTFDSDGFTLNWTKVDSSEREFLFVGFGSAPPVGGIAEVPPLRSEARTSPSASGASSTVVLAAVVAGGVLLIMAGAWYTGNRSRP